MSALVHLFGYGSLIATPEQSNTVVRTTLGRIEGYRRVFNKRSPSRGCPADDGFTEFRDEVPDCFVADGHNHSLAVGTAVDPNAVLYGALVSYSADKEASMLAATDRREGYNALADQATLGYLRVRQLAYRPVSRDFVNAWIYVSNPTGDYHLTDETPLSVRAKILIRATPRPTTETAQKGRALGLNYLEQIRRGLADWNVIDRQLEQIAQAVHSLPGPWVNQVAPPAG